MNPNRVDSLVDLTYGLLIAVSVGLIVVAGNAIGLAFGFGVLVSYVLHVVWKMARFDPNWMTTAVKETVEETVNETVEQTVGETVEKTVEETVGETVEKTLEEQRAATIVDGGEEEATEDDETEDR